MAGKLSVLNKSIYQNGKPEFMLCDTAWFALLNLTVEEFKEYASFTIPFRRLTSWYWMRSMSEFWYFASCQSRRLRTPFTALSATTSCWE